MAGTGSMGRQAIEIGKNIYNGMNGKYGQYAVKEGEKIIRANMSQSQIDRIEKVALNSAKKGFMHNNKRVFGDEAYKHSKDFMSNKINIANSFNYKLGDAIGGGVRDSVKHYKNTKKLGLDTNMKASLSAGFNKMNINDKGEVITQLRPERVAGAMFGAGVAGRIATGGGLYRDKNGNMNLPGIPFI